VYHRGQLVNLRVNQVAYHLVNQLSFRVQYQLLYPQWILPVNLLDSRQASQLEPQFVNQLVYLLVFPQWNRQVSPLHSLRVNLRVNQL
jgi:hypothetical protein